jgi:translation initiation factor IF-1
MFEGKPPVAAEVHDDRRTAERIMTVFLVVKLHYNGTEGMGRVVNLSEIGAQVETSASVEKGTEITIELRSDLQEHAVVRWTNGQAIGVEFPARIDPLQFLSRKTHTLSRIKPRPPRFRRNAVVDVKDEEKRLNATLLDVSLYGARLGGKFGYRPGDVVVVSIVGLRPRRAKVAWRNAAQMGLEFMLPLNFRDLDSWLVANQT